MKLVDRNRNPIERKLWLEDLLAVVVGLSFLALIVALCIAVAVIVS